MLKSAGHELHTSLSSRCARDTSTHYTIFLTGQDISREQVWAVLAVRAQHESMRQQLRRKFLQIKDVSSRKESQESLPDAH
jgi:hypothetical protein